MNIQQNLIELKQKIEYFNNEESVALRKLGKYMEFNDWDLPDIEPYMKRVETAHKMVMDAHQDLMNLEDIGVHNRNH